MKEEIIEAILNAIAISDLKWLEDFSDNNSESADNEDRALARLADSIHNLITESEVRREQSIYIENEDEAQFAFMSLSRAEDVLKDKLLEGEFSRLTEVKEVQKETRAAKDVAMKAFMASEALDRQIRKNK